MNDDSGLFCLLGMAVVGLPPMLILLTSLAPGYVERARAVMRARPGRSFLLGLVNFMFFGAVSLLLGVSFRPVALLGALALFLVLPLFLLMGLLTATGIVGERVWLQITSRSSSLLGSLLIGTLALGLTVLVPIFGWLLLMGSILTGLGAAIVALVPRKKVEPKSPLVEAE